MNYNQYISADPEVLGGKPRIANTRISVGLILEQLSLGDTIDNLLEEYDLTREQILAALAFASERMYVGSVNAQKRPLLLLIHDALDDKNGSSFENSQALTGSSLSY